MFPQTLNNYPVVGFVGHGDGSAHVLVEKPNEFVTATWAPGMGSEWAWGHYFPKKAGAFQAAVRDLADRAGGR